MRLTKRRTDATLQKVMSWTFLQRATALGLTLSFAVTASPLSASAGILATARPLAAAPVERDPNFALASNVAACGLLDVRMVQRSIDQLVAARNANAVRPVETPESRNILGGREARAAYVRSILKTKPARMPITTVHPMSAVEFATFRAAETAVRERTTALVALSQCRGEALLALAGGARGARPDWQSGPGGGAPYFPPVLEAVTGSGGYSDVYASGGVPNSANVRASSGSVIGTTSYSSVTISGLPGTNGSVPGFTSHVSITGTPESAVQVSIPNPAYVPQSGWTVVPGATWKGSAVSMYLNPTASTPTATVIFDSSDYLNVTQPGTGELQVNIDAASTNVYVQNNCVFTGGAQGVGTGLMDIGEAAGALGQIGISTGLFAPEGAVLQGLGAAIWGLGALTKWVFGPLFGGACGSVRPRTEIGGSGGMRPRPDCDSSEDDDDF